MTTAPQNPREWAEETQRKFEDISRMRREGYITLEEDAAMRLRVANEARREMGLPPMTGTAPPPLTRNVEDYRAEVDRLELHDPILRAAMTIHRQGHATREQALEMALVHHIEQNERLKEQKVRLLRNQSPVYELTLPQGDINGAAALWLLLQRQARPQAGKGESR